MRFGGVFQSVELLRCQDHAYQSTTDRWVRGFVPTGVISRKIYDNSINSIN